LNIRFSKIRYKNFLSSGNIFSEIELLKHKTTLIVGKNGAGKSTILDAIVFALYGKPFRKITKPQLINSINKKDMLVEVEFYILDDQYMIRRGAKPNIFEIFKNGKMIDQNSTMAEYQDFLEQNILKMNLKSFVQIVILGSATYVPLMQLTAQNRREVIEDLLDIQVFSTMNVLLKQKISDNKNLIQENGYEINVLETKIESARDNNNSIKKIKQIQVDDIKEKVKKQLEIIEQETYAVETIQDEIALLIESISDKQVMKNKYDKMKELRYSLETNKNNIIKEISFYDNHDNCPTCKQGIAHVFKDETVTNKKSEVQTIIDGISKLDIKMDEVNVRLIEISKTEDGIQKKNITIGEHRGDIRMAKSTLSEYKNELNEAEKEVRTIDESKIVELSDELKEAHKAQEGLYEDKETLNIVSSMLKDGGIKTRIIKQYIPVMNKLINKYLAEFELFVEFHLDENFNEVIKSRFRDEFSYMSFSEGEKMRINLAILLTWRSVSKMRNSVSTNLLIFDEIFDGSLDNVGVDSLIKVLNGMTGGDNIFVISHKGDALMDHFDSTIKVEKQKNFSQIES